MPRSKRDQAQIAQFEHDEVTDAKRVTMVNTEISIELDAADGDSVTSHPEKTTAEALGVVSPGADGTVIIAAFDASSLRQIRAEVDGAGTLTVEASPSDTANVWYTVGGAGAIHDICARRIRVSSVNIAGDVYLVGRS